MGSEMCIRDSLWFVTIHAFEDGNGRIARAIGDMVLARADGTPERCNYRNYVLPRYLIVVLETHDW